MFFNEPGTRTHVMVYPGVPKEPYPRYVVHKQSPWGLRDVFATMMFFSGACERRPALCRDFLPRLHLMVYSDWDLERHGLPALLEDWSLLEQMLLYWVDRCDDTSTGFSVYLQHSYAVASPLPEVDCTDLALEVVREYC